MILVNTLLATLISFNLGGSVCFADLEVHSDGSAIVRATCDGINLPKCVVTDGSAEEGMWLATCCTSSDYGYSQCKDLACYPSQGCEPIRPW